MFLCLGQFSRFEEKKHICILFSHIRSFKMRIPASECVVNTVSFVSCDTVVRTVRHLMVSSQLFLSRSLIVDVINFIFTKHDVLLEVE